MAIGAILAGGYGKRLGSITSEIPKPLIEIKKEWSIMHKQLFDFKYIGINEVYLLVGYKNEKIKEIFGEEWNGIKLHYLVEKEPKGTLYAINNFLKHIDTDCLIRNGDIVTDINFNEFINFAVQSNYDASIVLTKMRSPYGIINLIDDKVIEFVEKPIINKYINAGIYYFKKSSYEYFNREYDGRDVEMTVFQDLVASRKMNAYIENNVFWQSIDSIKDLENVRKEYENKEDKPWGYEKVVINTEKYMTKKLYIKKGYQTSMHYHPNKDETMHLISGSGYILSEDGGKNMMKKDEVIRIKPKTLHSIVATNNLVLMEYSTPHLEDTVRVKDYYNR